MKTPLIHLAFLLIFLSSDIVINQGAACTINITIKDGPVIQVSESQTVLPVTFLRSGDTAVVVTILATTHIDTAKDGLDFVSFNKTITFASSINETTENFTILNNTILEHHIERFFINITSSDSAVCTPYPTVIIQIKDDDKVTIGFKREFTTVTESIGNVSMSFFKSPTGGTEIPLTARYFTKGTVGNATLNTDYQNISKYITFAPLQYTIEKPDAVAIIDNDVVEYTKCFNMSMDATHPNVMSSREAMICILNDDKATKLRSTRIVGRFDTSNHLITTDGLKPVTFSPPVRSEVTIEFRYANMSVEEDLGNISVPVIKTGRSAIPISVRMTMKEDYNTAIKDVDYEDRHNEILTFPKDESEMIFNVTIKNDHLYESTESFFIGIEALDSSTTTIGSKSLAVIRITDRIDNEINQERQRQIEAEQKRRTVLMSYLLYVIVAVLIVMIIIFIFLIVMIIKKMRKYRDGKA